MYVRRIPCGGKYPVSKLSLRAAPCLGTGPVLHFFKPFHVPLDLDHTVANYLVEKGVCFPIYTLDKVYGAMVQQHIPIEAGVHLVRHHHMKHLRAVIEMIRSTVEPTC